VQRARDAQGWLWPAVVIVGAITVLRLGLLAFDRTDLFVDESQYWLWGQDFAFGYYSKPPLIAWVIGCVTAVFGDDPFWVRMPGAVFHGATALILGALAAQMQGRHAAFWVAVAYVTLPFVAVGSLLISTDTIMAPFFATALYFHYRLVTGGGVVVALMCGAMAGLAFLAKYAAVYFLGGVVLAALIYPTMRIAPRHALAMLVAFGAVIAPNILWNLNHDLTTVSHTMDNVGWLRSENPLSQLDPARTAEFLASQFAVFGPIMAFALILATFRRGTDKTLLPFILPALIIVSGQALLEKAYANWAVSAYFAGTVLAIALLMSHPRLLRVSMLINGLICVVLPLLTVFPQATFGRAEPLLQRYLGRAELSRQIIAESEESGRIPIVAESRDVLADLFYTGARSGLKFYAPATKARPMNHYAQTYPLPANTEGSVLLVSTTPPACDGMPPVPAIEFDTRGGAYQGDSLAGYVIKASCLAAK
jgi:4-amino-4-deoxy-L-arabinose transferase-like glycosyltransferase